MSGFDSVASDKEMAESQRRRQAKALPACPSFHCCDACGGVMEGAVRVEGEPLLCQLCSNIYNIESTIVVNNNRSNNLTLSPTVGNVSIGTIFQSDAKRRARRFFIKAKTGIAVALACGYLLRWWVFTESDEAIKAGKKFWFEMRMARQMLRRKYGNEVQMIVVEHRQGFSEDWIGVLRGGDCQRHNFHVIEYGVGKLDYNELSDFWKRQYLSTMTGLELIRSPLDAVNYLSGYLTEPEKFVKARFTHGWVFPHWWEYGKYYRKYLSVDDSYPSTEDLVRLALMWPEERSNDINFREFELATAKELWQVRLPQIARILEKRGVAWSERVRLLELYKQELLKGHDIKI